ncbi:MAG: CDP-alcohol phosphatidyltransferase family protein [bacterium]
MKVKDIFYISNLLSLSRVVLVGPIFYFLKLQTPTAKYWAVVFMLVAAATDIFDGRLARRLNQVSDYGRIIDPVADKIGIAVVAIVLVTTRGLPLWYLIAIVARDATILVFGLFLVQRTKRVVESNKIGKVTVTALGAVVIVFTLQIDAVKWVFLWISVGLLALSSASYFWKLITLLKQQSQEFA